MSECDHIAVDDEPYRITPMQQAAASCSGALITSLLVTPLDVVKIRMQAQQKATLKKKCFLYCNGLMDHICTCDPTQSRKDWYSRPGHFNGTIDAFVKITRTEGIASLWSGLSPTLVLAVPTTVVYFVTYEQLRQTFKEISNRNRKIGEPCIQPLWVPLLAGSAARTIAVSLVSPMELIRTKMQSRKFSYAQVADALKVLVRQDGIFGLWRGLFATLLRDVPFSALYWTQYETLKKWYGPEVPSFSFSFLAGAISGAIASIVTLPFDVVKTHQQIELGETLADTKAKHSSAFKLIKRLYTQNGISSLFSGLVPRVIKVAPACAIMIATFEHGKVQFNKLANSLHHIPASKDDDKEGASVPVNKSSSNSLSLKRDVSITTSKCDLI